MTTHHYPGFIHLEGPGTALRACICAPSMPNQRLTSHSTPALNACSVGECLLLQASSSLLDLHGHCSRLEAGLARSISTVVQLEEAHAENRATMEHLQRRNEQLEAAHSKSRAALAELQELHAVTAKVGRR